ncbi:MAG: hypothetical protein JXA20_18550 [Spirochaetes bacterium]|nr:hypothetical protein [Spirochaetota bacterium]
MYRFSSLDEYNRRLDELTDEIWRLTAGRYDPQRIIECEQLKLSYMIEKKDFISRFKTSEPF